MKNISVKRAFAIAALAAVALSSVAQSANAAKTKKPKPSPTTVATVAPTAAPTTEAPKPKATIRIGSIPDQDPAKIQRGFGIVAKYLEAKLGQKVEFVPVADYAAAVTAFRIGDLDLVWFGGMTGVQAQKQVKDAIYIAQRDIDAKFKSVFITNSNQKLPEIDSVAKLVFLKGFTFTFGSESSTSGRMMPQYFLDQAGVQFDDFKGQVGYSGSHDRTIRLVESGTYDAGVLNKAVWDSNVAAKTVNLEKVRAIFTTPSYFDYHWLARQDFEKKFGDGSAAKLKSIFLGMTKTSADSKEVLEFFSAESFIDTKNENYKDIEKVGKRLGLVQ
jgi:phosphonate transport system substrate-binding protein